MGIMRSDTTVTGLNIFKQLTKFLILKKKRDGGFFYMCLCGCIPYQVITFANIGTMTPKAMLGTKLINIA